MTAASAPSVRLVSFALLLSQVGCAGHAPATVDPRRPANSDGALDRLAEQVSEAELTPRSPGFVALTVAGELVFVDDTGHVPFRTTSTAASVRVSGQAIAEVSSSHLAFRAWPTGDALLRVRRDEGSQLVGASMEGSQLAVVEATGPRRAHIRLGTWSPRGARFARTLPADGVLGAPLLRGGVLLIPHDGHELLLLDASDGDELARRRSHDDSIRWARVDQGRVYFGGRRVYALRPGVASMTAADAVLDPDLALVPAPPIDAQLDARLEHDAAHAGTPQATALEATRPAPVHWVRVPLEPSDTPEADRAYVVTRSHVFAFDGLGTFRFVHQLAMPPLATLATADGLVLLHADGQLESLHPDDGSPRFAASLPALRSAEAVLGTGVDTRRVEARRPPEVAETLLQVLRTHDTRSVPDQVYAAHLLSTVNGSVGAELLALYVDRRTEPPVRDAIATTLRTRANDADALVEALNRPYDFLSEAGEQPPPPLLAIVPALARAERSDAYPALLQHLTDPATPLDALPLVIDQLVRWGGPDALRPVLDFLRRYRADSAFATDVTALVHAARAVDALGGPSERSELRELIERSGTHAALIEGVAQASRARAAVPLATPNSGGVTTGNGTAVDEQGAPRLASSESVAAYALEQMDRISPCIAAVHAEQPSLRTVRVRMVLERGGRVSLVSVLPGGALERCIADAAVTMRWPPIRSLRQQVGFALRLGPDAPPESLRSAPPWWAAAATHAPRGVAVQPGLPWWAVPERANPTSTGDDQAWWPSGSADTSDAQLDRWWLPADTTPSRLPNARD